MGPRGVEGLKLVFSFPKGTVILKSIVSTEPTLIPCELKSTTEDNAIERIYEVGRLEKNDRLTLSFLLNIDSQNPGKIMFQPRGVDDIDYVTAKNAYPLDSPALGRISPAYMWGVLMLTILAITSLTLSIVAGYNDVQEVFDISRTMTTATFGALLGMLAGRSL